VFEPTYCTEDDGILGAALDAFSSAIDSWPIAERFADLGYVPECNEFTVHSSSAPTLLAFGALAQLEPSGEEPGDSDSGAEGPERGGCRCRATDAGGSRGAAGAAAGARPGGGQAARER